MPIENYIIEVFCLIEDYLPKVLEGKRLRRRGPQPALQDSEVITMEIVGEMLGFADDKSLWHYFKQHWCDWFPRLGSRETFIRQAANLWRVKEKLQELLAQRLGAFDDRLHLFDGFPIPMCHLKRSGSSNLRGEASYSYCAAKAEKYYGFKGHLVVSSEGIITDFAMATAHIDERDVLPEVTERFKGLLIADKGLIRPELNSLLATQGIDLQIPYRCNMIDNRPKWFVKKITSIRRLVETVIGQLVEHFHIQMIHAKTTWHVLRRVTRKLLAHTVAFSINKKINPDNPLQFERLLIC